MERLRLVPCNGWKFWNYERAPGDWVRLRTLRHWLPGERRLTGKPVTASPRVILTFTPTSPHPELPGAGSSGCVARYARRGVA